MAIAIQPSTLQWFFLTAFASEMEKTAQVKSVVEFSSDKPNVGVSSEVKIESEEEESKGEDSDVDPDGIVLKLSPAWVWILKFQFQSNFFC